MDCVRFEFNDIMYLSTKYASERRRFVSLDILYYGYKIVINGFILFLYQWFFPWHSITIEKIEK